MQYHTYMHAVPYTIHMKYMCMQYHTMLAVPYTIHMKLEKSWLGPDCVGIAD